MCTVANGTAATMRSSGQAVSRPWVVIPPRECPATPTPVAVSRRPANGEPGVVLSASVLVRTSETSWDWLPL